MSRYPRWIHKDSRNLREVAPRIYVGSAVSTLCSPPNTERFSLAIDLCGLSASQDTRLYPYVDRVINLPFADGDRFPEGYLDEIHHEVMGAIGRGPVLLHCQAGLSRSASVGYALNRVMFGLDHMDALARVVVPGQEKNYPRTTTLGSARAWVHEKRRDHTRRLVLPT